MFNFHKPRTYRSTEGCCICRVKSSSSRFTDSRKYDRDTTPCFDLKTPRRGEICNACVLLVKRFKRLPPGSKRNWSHVVDARAGPGGSKIQTKYRNDRIGSRSSQTNSGGGSAGSSSSSLFNNCSTAGTSSSAVNGMPSYIPEKFSKIYKKTKKLKESTSSSSLGSYSSSSSSSLTKLRKSSNNGWTQNTTSIYLPTTPDSLDSDYEDSGIHHHSFGSSGAVGTVVQFQTQTRASAFRAQAAAEAKRKVSKLGSNRRKCLSPRKNRVTANREEDMQFFDKDEWRDQKSCCGILYECPALGGALIVDEANYKPCENHKGTATAMTPQQSMTVLAPSESAKDHPISLVMPPQRATIQTMPAVVQLQPPAPPGFALSVCSVHPSNAPPSSSSSSSLTITKTSTPVLKKHHLFFKRQSECFPHGDMVTQSDNFTTNYNTTTPPSKTESDYNNRAQQHQTYTTTKQQRHNDHAIQHTSATLGTGTNFSISTSAALSISVTSVAASASAPAMPVSLASSFSLPSSSYTCSMPQMPKHSLAKVTTISPPLTASHMTSTSSMPLTKPNNSNILHKVKTDSCKIVKHSLERFNTAVRLKSSDLHDMKPIIKTVDKSYILAKPPAAANNNTFNAATPATTTYPALSTFNSGTCQPHITTTTSLSAASPTSSTSSTSSTKFSDNSSDSGFDENMLERKSASPLQEECEKKLLSRPGVHTMFLASGVQIQGQPQNLMLTGNEVAAKILQNRKYSSIATTSMASNVRTLSNNHPTATAVKIAQISTGGGGHHSPSSSIMSSAAQAKMRAIYNSSNTIQHENGITTIVPASSLAATTQTAAMQNIAPSTVTITPAPLVAGGVGGVGPSSNQFSAQNIISRKLTAANIINLQSNNLSNTTNISNNHGVIGNHLMNSSAVTANQKIILLKTSSHSMAATHHQQQQLLHQQTSVVASKYGTLHQATNGVGGVGNGSMMGR